LAHFANARHRPLAPEGLRNCAVIIDLAGFGKGKSIIACPIDPTAPEG
jgi:hypothetical protein